MFSIQRFDGGSAGQSKRDGDVGPSGSARAKLDRIALLNQRKAEQQNNTPASVPLGNDGAKLDARSTIGGLKIHPSRLAASQALRQSDKKARSSANGTAKEKTKAKQRYLNRKKDRRKKRKVATVASAPKKNKLADARTAPSGRTEEDGSNSDEASSLSEDEDDVQEQIHDGRADIETNQVGKDAKHAAETREVEMQDASQGGSNGSQVQDGGDEELQGASSDVEVALSEQGVLSRFPAPRTTSQISRRELAAQGLPEGLAQPEVVETTRTATVAKSDHRALDTISDGTKARLESLGITEWFAVQTAIIPKLLAHPLAYDLYPSPALGDVCVSAPTGSGKTLSYVVPIVEVLQRRLCRRLRALILLPTRDLVHQVRETLEAVCKGTGLTIASLTGHQSFAHEQSVLVDADTSLLRKNVPGLRNPAPGSEEERVWVERRREVLGVEAERPIESKVDIVIATPGRLIDHLDQTPGFTLQHLRFLVIDEADRLLSQSFQEWLPRVLAALDPRDALQHHESVSHAAIHASQSAMSPAWLAETRWRLGGPSVQHSVADRLPRPESGVQKLLFSATLTRDPAKIVALNLRDTTFFSVEDTAEDDQEETEVQAQDADWPDKFSLPATLHEHMFVSSTAEKPLQLLHLLYTHDPPLRQVLCFTKSVESAVRLVKLLELFEEARQKRHGNRPTPVLVREHSSELRGAQRMRLLDEFKSGKVDVVVCSDVISRGIDLPMVRHVISYDAPIDMAKHVHRVGRTARAGRQGDAWTLVEEQEARHFIAMMRRAGRWKHVDRIRPPKALRAALGEETDTNGAQGPDKEPFTALVRDYRSALARLEAHFSQHKRA